MTRRLRRAGARWRLLVHEWEGRRQGHREGFYGISHNVKSDPRVGLFPDSPDRIDGGWNREHILPNTDFDELVVGHFLHIEEMSTGVWWMNVGGLVLHVQADRDGRPVRVWSEGVETPQPGCTYDLTGDWT